MGVTLFPTKLAKPTEVLPGEIPGLIPEEDDSEGKVLMGVIREEGK
jgi:hypothetical protein